MGIGQSSEKKLLANNAFECALYATQGYRKGMEDAHVMAISLPKHPSYSLFGVFDGFNGDDASTYFAEHLMVALDELKDLDDDDSVIKVVSKMDTKYIHSDNAEQHNPNAGCTFVFAIINTVDLADLSMTPLPYTPYIYSNSVSSICSRSFCGDLPSITTPTNITSPDVDATFRVRVFWAGDARAVLVSDNRQFQKLTHDHHCSVPDEAKRIKNANGTISNGRIDGIVEVTRGFGCRAMKSDASLPPHKQKMISVPEHNTVICGNHDRLLIFCDGLSKTWTDQQFNIRWKHHLMQHKDEKQGELKAIKYLCKQAMDEGSKDNITAISIKFK
eukprot:418172_1